MEKILNNDTQQRLRAANLITESEVVLRVADKYVAENVITKTRRIIEVPDRLIENRSTKRVLRG
ncbi:MAG TPA: hypothetical protein DF712_17650, partial [Balneola sp.]|nr:hypothetical protein [Balneola sp.]|tara:strand:+ start:758 stop:949 length:192 start_codon:yes stop_codon:yes gene_type:complete